MALLSSNLICYFEHAIVHSFDNVLTRAIQTEEDVKKIQNTSRFNTFNLPQ